MKKIQKLIVLLLVLFNMQPYLNSGTLTVTSTADSGPNTLRNQIAAANPEDVINFDPNLGTITINSGPLKIIPTAFEITIQGNTTGTPTVIDGSGMTPGMGAIFNISGSNIVLNNLTIQNGMGGTGTFDSINGKCSGIIVSSANAITISNCSITGCQANGYPYDTSQFPFPSPFGAGGTGGIEVTNSNNVIISACSITNCKANGGLGDFAGGKTGNGGTGGISISGGGSNTINNNTTVESCQANGGISNGEVENGFGGVGGISLIDNTSSNTIDGIIVMNNQANDGTVGPPSPNAALGGAGAILISGSSTTLNIIENNTIESNSATHASGRSVGSSIRIQNGANNNSITSNNISNNQISIGATGVLITDGSNSNLISSNTIINNISAATTGGVISIEKVTIGDANSVLNSILSNTIHDNTPVIPIALSSGSNNNQQAPAITSAMACPCAVGGTWQLFVSGVAPAAASGGTGEILINAFFNTLSDPECNTYVGSFQVPAGQPFTNQTLPIASMSDITGFLSLTATNSNGTNPPSTRAPGDIWGDTSVLSDQAVVVVS